MSRPSEDQLSPFWYWINERHRIYWKKAGTGSTGSADIGNQYWTEDEILKTYRFCNVYRELDRVTLWFKYNIREPFSDNENLWFMYCIARQFNWPPTIKALMDKGLWPSAKWNGKAAGKLLDKLSKEGMQQYNGAYMVCGCGVPEGWSKSRFMCEVMFQELWEKRKEVSEICKTTIEDTTKYLAGFYGWGMFLGYEVACDLSHSKRWLDKAPDIMTWANVGPGAKRGLNRLWGRPLKQSIKEAQAVDEMKYLLELSPLFIESHLHLPFTMREIEHSLCEVDKYLRVKTGEGRPKALYRPYEKEYDW